MSQQGAGRRSGPDGLRALDRSVAVLLELAAEPAGLSLAEIARRTGLTLTTVHRLVQALRAHRLTRETVDGLQALGPATLVLARGFLGGLDFRVEALPVLADLREKTDEACYLGTLASPHVVYVDKLDSTHPLQVTTRIGSTAPAVSTALGRAILAWSDAATVERVLEASRSQLGLTGEGLAEELAAARERGYAVGTTGEGLLRCLGAPVLDESGSVIAAIELAIPLVRLGADDEPRLGHLVKEAAARTSAALGYLEEMR